MVSFKLDEEIQKDAFHFVMFLYQAYNLPHFQFYSQNMTLSTLLILAVSRMCIIYDLCNGPCPPQSLTGSVVEHQSMESKGLRVGSSQRLRIFSLSYAGDKMRKIFPYYQVCIFNQIITLRKMKKSEVCLQTKWPIQPQFILNSTAQE